MKINWDRVVKHFTHEATLVGFYYYIAVERATAPDWLIKMIDWMERRGFTVITRDLKPRTRTMVDDAGKKQVLKGFEGDMDAYIAADMVDLADRMDKAVLFSGDADFCRAAQILKRRGVRVQVVSSGPNLSVRLRNLADEFVYLERIREQVEYTGGDQERTSTVE